MEDNLILNIPFDEPAGSLIAYDYSRNRADGTVIGAEFVAGKNGNAIKFNGTGHCDIEKNPINLNEDFSLLAWLKRSDFPDELTGKKIGFFLCWDEIGAYKEQWFNINSNAWGYWAIVKKGLEIKIYLDTQLIGNITLPAHPSGFSLIQDIYSYNNGYGYLDEVKAYSKALTESDILSTLNKSAQLSYSIDGIDFKNWDIHVSESNGILDRPKLKPGLKIEWDDYHGEMVDINNKRVEAREITLNCFMRASAKMEFVTKLNEFLDIFSRDGTQRLMVDIHPIKPLLYEVYNESGVTISKRWNDDLMVGTFSLKLKEPEPVKRVVRHQKRDESSKTLTISISTPKMVTIHWGDGTRSESIYGDNKTITHDYADNGIYYAIISGVIERIEEFNTNGIIVFNKI